MPISTVVNPDDHHHVYGDDNNDVDGDDDIKVSDDVDKVNDDPDACSMRLNNYKVTKEDSMLINTSISSGLGKRLERVVRRPW